MSTTPEILDYVKVTIPTEDVPAATTTTGVTTTRALKPKATEPGMKCETKDFYKNKDASAWTHKYPDYLEEAVENDETAQLAFLKRNDNSSSTRKKFSLNSIIVQSPLLKKALGKVFENYEGVTTDLKRLKFKKPFAPFVHRWEKFEEVKENETDEITKKHLELLWDTLEFELRDTIVTQKDLIANGVMTHDYLWTMFEPGCLVLQKSADFERIMEVQSASYDGFHTLEMKTLFVEWDGKDFGMETEDHTIDKFEGTKKISELSMVPLSYHEDSVGVQQRCIERGRTWESLCGYHFKQYKGVGTNISEAKFNIESRIIIDTAAFNTFNPNNQVCLANLRDDDSYKAPSTETEPKETATLTPYQLLLASKYLRGYSLKDKQWFKLDLGSVREIEWNETAFSSLVLPEDTKDLVRAFAQSQIQQEEVFDDVIKGKGKGVIMLLSGPPGVGKTLTAEAVAETTRIPLYSMSAGDLGTDPASVESTLKTIFTMTTKWKAVLLLDEADVFLEARSKNDLERNKLVSIFLRMLEYFEGFLFLTSNRVEDMDAAFESRIHLSLQYSDLSFESRRQVWLTFVDGSDHNDNFTDDQIDALAELELNGRQIKNIIKTAQLLATSKAEVLNFQHVQVITKLRAKHAACLPLRSS
ncbi:P-loop containing nucleoside triphosphate hydrolase [Glarea lozoyensis ATCC 20868]|uniref:p-loop containing nucleoside triphosphate hydrolase n=2 Tax=Glarea lozoyensis TaxID=101852 RepID=S3CKD8_GLAL2|nr:P-loop containing nucleoside triphosphate hydrolase [Glarea lozoyensis ATCC 20868]EHK97647.1 putative ATP-dependent zinc metalloprotease FtsH [Glarea lozoyensis 74030]EPE25679.1 P-loop containing nucleoside triphosphate hydrolase [Glarea lozoyensis ATCC 20868]